MISFLYLRIIKLFHPIGGYLTFVGIRFEKGGKSGGLVCFVCQFDRIH